MKTYRPHHPFAKAVASLQGRVLGRSNWRLATTANMLKIEGIFGRECARSGQDPREALPT